ncbi:oligopeptide/dipeptide ABC transporter ATP-binding protein [Acutalibacter sp.]|jgi:oligopeptide transport system ATP-binding protein|uniref:oligopeptide/dipeptide ABC transporter ATP-binding protein n=1 Tax=Acutalibacter sp. TaxID=1918636 RepID=UPI002ED0B278
MEMNNRKVLLSIKDLEVKFRVRGRILTAIRGINLDIYENESIAIVGESGSGKSVFTKTFAGMLDSNGFIDNGKIIFNDEELADTHVRLMGTARNTIASTQKKLDEYAKLEHGSATYRRILELESERKQKMSVSDQEAGEHKERIEELRFKRAEAFNLRQTLDARTDREQIKKLGNEIKGLDNQIKRLEQEYEAKVKKNAADVKADSSYQAGFNKRMEELKAQYAKETSVEISAEQKKRNEILAKEIYLSVGRYPFHRRISLIRGLLKEIKKAMQLGVDPMDDAVFDKVVFRVRYIDETAEALHGTCTLNLANVKFAGDWAQIRGRRIATVFQDPMTSLNPIITIGKQITSIILKHQNCSEVEARARAIELMHKVGIPNAEARFDDYPFQYSGGMRQRIVIAIALSCQPKILICDEPTTALDVTIQAQIIKLIKDLQKEFGYTIVFITHDLGVVANIADRVAVLYAGQIVELGQVEEVFYDPRHPYTWALLSSLPQLAQRNTKLYSITGTPPSLYNQIVGDPFAPRNPYCLKLDTLMEPPMFPVTETHFAKTWLLDPRAPKTEKPELIQDIHEKLMRAFNI